MLQGNRGPFENIGLDEGITDVLTASLRKSTQRQYQVYWTKWTKFCGRRKKSPLRSSVNFVLEFLAELFHQEKASYSTLNAARSALSLYVTLENSVHSVGTQPLICRFLKGTFNLRPPQARYQDTWDVGIALKFLRRLSSAKTLSLKQLTHKLCLLLALVSAQRVQTLHLLNLDKMELKQSSVSFHVDELLKHSRPGHHGFTMKLKAYPPDRRVCIVNYLRAYVKRTESIRGPERRLFISYTKPYGKVSSQTISRWIKVTLAGAGIDTSVYKSHSTRSAATSAAIRASVPISSIMNQAGWSRERTFQQFYNKPLADNGETEFSQAILQQ